jgi:hypothetical protein
VFVQPPVSPNLSVAATSTDEAGENRRGAEDSEDSEKEKEEGKYRKRI